MKKKHHVALLTGILALTLLTGCGSGGEGPVSAQPQQRRGADDAFPVNIESAYGEVTIPARPVRVLSLAQFHVDSLVSLGVQPVAAWSSNAENPWEYYLWLNDTYTGQIDPDLIDGDYVAQLEAVAKWKPDLIVGDTSMITDATYDDFATIAPTYLSATLGANDMRQSLQDLAKATGTVAKGEEVLADLDALRTDARADLACVQGKSYRTGFLNGDELILSKVAPLDLLGLEPADDYSAGIAPQRGALDLENIDQFDADVLAIGIWADPETPKTLGADPRFNDLPATQQDAVLFGDGPNAVAGNGPMGLEWQINGLVSKLTKSAYCAEGATE